MGQGLVSEADSVRHAQARDILAPAFRAQAVKDLVPIFTEVAQQMIRALAAKQGQEVGG